VHADPWSEDCILEPVNQTYKAELMDFMKNNKRIQQLAESFEPEEEDEIQEERVPRTPRIPRNRSGTNQPQDKLKFPIWKENLSWSEYEPMITWYRETSTKEVKTQFMEMINALNSSDKENISTRLMQAFKGQGSNLQLMDEAVKWLDSNYGASKTDRVKKVADLLQSIRRKDDEDMAEFIIRFEALMDQMRSVNMILSEQVESAILHNAANLNKTEENNILPLVDITSGEIGTTTKLKDALRSIGFRKDKKKKEEVVLLQYDNQEYEGCQGTQDEPILFGRGGYQDNNRGQFNNRGFQQQQRGNQNQRGYQNMQRNQGQQGQFQVQRNFQGNFHGFQRNQTQTNKQVGTGIVNAIHDLPQNEQMELVGVIAKTFMKPSVVIPQGSTQGTNNPGQTKVYQVNQEDEDEVFISTDLERIYLADSKDHTSVIIDTGSAYNLIGHHLIPILRQRLAQAETEIKIIPTTKKFQFGGRQIISSTGKIMVPLVLGRTEVLAEVYIMETEIPFLIGGTLLRQQKTEISVTNNNMTVNNHKIDLHLLKSGHMALKGT